MKVRRYSSRNLHGMDGEGRLNLAAIRDAVQRGEALEVVDAATGADRTAVVLLSILLAEAEAGRPCSVARLRALVAERPEVTTAPADAAAPAPDPDSISARVERIRAAMRRTRAGPDEESAG